tara:strand:- start:1003 stop:1311 length:309 start_codon:yes stop_codon:yes gene_type:complete
MSRMALLFALLLSCSPSEKDGLIEREKFINIHHEILTIETAYQLKYRALGIYKDSLKHSVDVVLKKNGVTFDQYSKTYSYYAVNQKDLQKINKELIGIIEKD